MIRFNHLAIENNHLVIDAQIEPNDWFKDCYIKSVHIDTQDTFTTGGYSSNAIYVKTYDGPKLSKSIKLYLDGTEFTKTTDLTKNIFFVWIEATGTPTIDTPCGFDKNLILGTVIDLSQIYSIMMDGINQIGNDCTIPTNFINNILQFNAMDFAIKTGNYPLAIKYWKDFFSDEKTVTSITNKCGCHG